MTEQIATDISGYDKISGLIGSEINKSFQDLLKKIIELEDLNFLGTDGVSLTKADLDNFLTVIGGAGLDIKFTPRLIKGTTARFSATDLASSAPGLLGGSISIGGSWSF